MIFVGAASAKETDAGGEESQETGKYKGMLALSAPLMSTATDILKSKVILVIARMKIAAMSKKLCLNQKNLVEIGNETR